MFEVIEVVEVVEIFEVFEVFEMFEMFEMFEIVRTVLVRFARRDAVPSHFQILEQSTNTIRRLRCRHFARWHVLTG